MAYYLDVLLGWVLGTAASLIAIHIITRKLEPEERTFFLLIGLSASFYMLFMFFFLRLLSLCPQ